MTRRAVVAIAVAGAAAAALPGAWLPWWVVLACEVAVAGASSWWTYTHHATAELAVLRRATAASDGLLLWEVRRHGSGRWSLVWARGASLLAWRDDATYRPTPDETGPYSYWLDTWTDPSGVRDERVQRALDTGATQRWTARDRGRVYDTEAIRSASDRVLCVTHDVTRAEEQGAVRGRDELVSLALDLDATRETHA